MAECREIDKQIFKRRTNDGRKFNGKSFEHRTLMVECWKSARKILEGSTNDGRMFEMFQSLLGFRAQQRRWTEIKER